MTRRRPLPARASIRSRRRCHRAISAARCDRPAARGQRRGRAAPAASGRTDSSATPTGRPRRVLDPHVLDVDAGLARRGEQPGQLAGLVADDDLHHRVVRGRAALLAGDPGHARRRRAPAGRSPAWPRHRRPRPGWPARRPPPSGRWRSPGSTSAACAALAARICGPQAGVARRDPGHVAQPWPGQGQRVAGAPAQPGRHRRGDQVRARARPGPPSGRAPPADIRTGCAPQAHGQRGHRLDGACCGGLGSGQITQGRPRNRSARAAAGPDRSRPDDAGARARSWPGRSRAHGPPAAAVP